MDEKLVEGADPDKLTDKENLGIPLPSVKPILALDDATILRFRLFLSSPLHHLHTFLCPLASFIPKSFDVLQVPCSTNLMITIMML